MGISARDVERLQEPNRVGVVATTRKNGTPHAVPIWYAWLDGAIYIWTADTTAWVRNVRRSPRIAMSVQDNDTPYGAVLVRGETEFIDDTWSEFGRVVRIITGRYVEPEGVEAYIAAWPQLRTIVRIRPDFATGWDSGD